MALTDEQVLEQLRSNGITSLEELAQKVAKQSEARARFAEEMDIRDQSQADYVWSGKNYSLYHPE